MRAPKLLITMIALLLSACGGTEPDFYETDGWCYAKAYFDGTRVIHTDDYVAYPGKCE